MRKVLFGVVAMSACSAFQVAPHFALRRSRWAEVRNQCPSPATKVRETQTTITSRRRRPIEIHARTKKAVVVDDPDDILTGDDDINPVASSPAAAIGANGEKDGEDEVLWSEADANAMGFGAQRIDTEPAHVYEPEEWVDRLSLLFVAVCLDRNSGAGAREEGSVFQQLRVPNMLNHMAWSRRSTRVRGAKARVVFDRTVLTADLQATCGNVIGIAAESQADAEELFAQEPYTAAGLYERAELFSWPRSNATELLWDRRPFTWLMFCEDAPDSLDLRLATRPSHTEYLKAAGRVTGGGPLLPLGAARGAGSPAGSLVFFNAATREEAEEFAANDPYATAGLFARVLLRRYNDLDVDGRFLVQRHAQDPLRDLMEKEGLALPEDYPDDNDDELL